ncbi:Putative acetyltransferase [Corynebacterium guangdongense]|nr:Putative acetyltransferase [Corynebacterium guangdongense]
MERMSDKYRSFDRMISGQWYLPDSAEATEVHERCWTHLKAFNDAANLEDASDHLAALLKPGSAVPETWAPLFIEYGVNTSFGEGCFINVGMTILDCAPVTVGARTLFGPECQLITVGHPVEDVQMRRDGWERAQPITIGEDCWFGAGVKVLPGVSVGDRCVIAAGAVVTRDVPDDSMVMGVPGRVVRTLNRTGESERSQIDL